VILSAVYLEKKGYAQQAHGFHYKMLTVIVNAAQVKKIKAQVSKCVSYTGLRQPAVTPTVVLERMQKQCLISSYVIVDVQVENASVNNVKPEELNVSVIAFPSKGLQRKEGFDYMELKGEHGLDLKTHSTKIHILNAYATLKTRTFYIVEASDRRLSGILDHLLYVYMLRWKNTLANVNDKAKKVTENTDNTPFEDSLASHHQPTPVSSDRTIETKQKTQGKVNVEKALDWFLKGVARGSTQRDRSPEVFVKIWGALCQKDGGITWKQQIPEMEEKGVLMVNVEKALDSFLKGAARGSTLAMVDAGLVYWEIGKKDEGVRMYKRAVELDDLAEQCNLGISYLQAME
ncbi:F-box protein, partial [Tanacetum coccineum]